MGTIRIEAFRGPQEIESIIVSTGLYILPSDAHEVEQEYAVVGAIQYSFFIEDALVSCIKKRLLAYTTVESGQKHPYVHRLHRTESTYASKTVIDPRKLGVMLPDYDVGMLHDPFFGGLLEITDVDVLPRESASDEEADDHPYARKTCQCTAITEKVSGYTVSRIRITRIFMESR